MRHDAVLASYQGKYSPAFKGSWLRAPVHSCCRGHGNNKLLFELANAVLLFYLRGREERNLPGALLCSAAGFVVPDLIKGCVGGSTEGKEKGEKRAGGAGGCTANRERWSAAGAARDELGEAEGWPGPSSPPLCPLLLGARRRAGPEEPSLGTARRSRGKARPSLA